MNLEKPVVSVLMTAYNRDKYIAEAIQSVLASSYKDFELIIVDDGSSDRTVEIARAFEAKDKRIRVYINKENLGQFENRNKAASYAVGKYIKFIDSDDIIYPHGIETMLNVMEMYPEAGLGFSHFRYDGSVQLPYLVSNTEAYREHYFRGGFLYNGPTGSIYRKDYFNQIGMFDCEYHVATDVAFNLKAALYKPVVVFQRDLFWWRPHNQQEINLKQDSYENLNFLINNHYLSLPECPLPEIERKSAINNLHNILGRRVLHALVSLDLKAAISKSHRYGITVGDLFLSMLPSDYRRRLQRG